MLGVADEYYLFNAAKAYVAINRALTWLSFYSLQACYVGNNLTGDANCTDM